jgi:hypothetical protein
MNRWLLIILLIIVAGILAAVFLTRAYVYAAPQQPVGYSHRTHVEAGVQCLYCHASAMNSDIAGIPSMQKCMGCHNIIATDSSAVQELTGYWERGEPILWERVDQQPDFVYFSHQPHLGAGVNCETCHGDVGSMEITRRAVKMDMGWCLDCHLEQPQEKVARLVDCIACHK